MSNTFKVTREIKALERTISILSPLTPEERGRILVYLHSVFDADGGGVGSTTSAIQHKTAPTVHGSGKPVSPQEFLREFNYKIMTKRIAVMAVYLERKRGASRFALKDLTAAFREAKEPKPPAQSQYGRAQIMGFIAKEGDLYYATSKAELLVDQYKSEKPQA
jgi:hypothetical protein